MRRSCVNPRLARPGTVLLLVLIVISVLSLAAYTFAQLMRNELRAARLHGQQAQARALADSGVEMIRAFLVQDEVLRAESGGHYDNPDVFNGVLVPAPAWADVSDAHQRARFSVLAPLMDDEGLLGGTRAGLEDESTRLNLNTLLFADEQAQDGGRAVLMALPGMTEETADAILDWIDEDDQPRQFGAEIDHYSGLDPPYAPKNGPLETVEELLMVRGVTPDLLFGADGNRNGVIDGAESGRTMIAGVDNTDGAMNHGWAAYLTLYSMEKNVRPDGTPKIDLNSNDMEQLFADLEAALSTEWATFIVAYKQNGPYNGNLRGQRAGAGKLDLSRQGRVPLASVLDLIGPRVRVTFQGEEDPVILETPFPNSPLLMNAYLPALLDQVTVNRSPTIPGRINVNQASRTVLLGIPGMSEEIVERIIGLRELDWTADQPNRRHETWLMSEGVVTLDEMKALVPFVTGAGSVYRAQIVGFFDGGGPTSRIEAIIDHSLEVPRVVFWRDLSHLDLGIPLATLGAEFDE